ncbi:hypothetical protein KB559_07920 [Paenibacillus sp. Marseille-P2973]|uniref:hypothetical protein n=1 Tax=Paenibacillus sp. Marseille-P2973 TaxID=1871032 RepID=UPI001B38BE52|nr:hypothetical protein [Paenibacillus sp. Marseille-P2973]MBQ4898761.1 hypothetical protein [Paenibacillus sp. Marseille-P2973]
MKSNEVMKPGVTGFLEEELSKQEIKDFEAYLYHAIRCENGKLIKTELLINNRNFYTYQIEMRTRVFHILLHSIFPFVAFASVVDYSGIVFMDAPEQVKTILRESYKVLETKLLNQALTREDTRTLGRHEQEMIKYWKPETIGEVIFNYWD